MRMPVADVDCLRASLGKQGITTVDASRVMRELRLVKSPFEVERIRHACTIGSAAFQFLPARLDMLQEAKAAAGQGGVTVRDARNEMRALMMEFGADDTPYVMTQAGNNGCASPTHHMHHQPRAQWHSLDLSESTRSFRLHAGPQA